jgi:hypothetical protein
MFSMRKVKSFAISSDLLTKISETKGDVSTSQRVNELLRRALELECRERLEEEASQFFAIESEHSSRERLSYQKAARKTLSRD